ncbi:MAG: hypothetical protein SGARI_000154 [Bacillariaceae sp.]
MSADGGARLLLENVVEEELSPSDSDSDFFITSSAALTSIKSNDALREEFGAASERFRFLSDTLGAAVVSGILVIDRLWEDPRG